MSKELLLKAAAELEARDKRIAELEAQLKTASDEKLVLAKSIAQTKEASEASDAEAQRIRAARATAAQKAAGLLYDAGLFATKEASEKLAADLLDHDKAINVIGNLSSRIVTPKVAMVVTETPSGHGDEPRSADQVWEQRCQNALSRMG